MRHHVSRAMCPCCRNSPGLRQICTVCQGVGEAIIVSLPNNRIELYPVSAEERIRAQYPAEPTPVHERATIAHAWERFAAMVEIPPQNVMQRREMRRSFYAGIHWVLEVLSIQLDPSGMPTADDLEYMQRIQAEIQRFNDDLQAGRA